MFLGVCSMMACSCINNISHSVGEQHTGSGEQHTGSGEQHTGSSEQHTGSSEQHTFW